MAIVKTQYDYWKEAHDQVMSEMAAMKMKYIIEGPRPNDHFKYSIQINDMLSFHNVRRWCVDTYGFGNSVIGDGDISNEYWGYYIVYQQYMLYFKGDKELAWFKIKYGDPND